MMLVGLDLVRALVVLALPFVSEIWQVYALVVVLQSASAAFTPTFQAVLPDILADERDYTRALSASQLASTMESLLSPVLVAAALSVVSFHWLRSDTAAARCPGVQPRGRRRRVGRHGQHRQLRPGRTRPRSGRRL